MKKIIITTLIILTSLLQAQQELKCMLTLSPFQGEGIEYLRNIKAGGDLNGDGYDDIVLGRKRYWDSENQIYTPSQINIYYGSADPDTIPDMIIYEKEFEGSKVHIGTIAYNGDINNDGYDDLVIGANYQPNSGVNLGQGVVYIHFGGDSLKQQANLTLFGSTYNPEDCINLCFGASIDLSGDFNGDGINDLTIASDGPDFFFNGQIDIFHGGNDFDIIVDWHKQGEPLDYFGGNGFSIGDSNNDGFSDLVVPTGWIQENNGWLNIFAGGLEMDKEPAWKNYLGEMENIFLDASGDINGDGFDDIVYSLNWRNNVNLISFDSNFLQTNSEFIFENNSEIWNLFYTDIDNDNIDDILISFPGELEQNTYCGSVNFETNSDYQIIDNDLYGLGIISFPLGNINGDKYSDIITSNLSNGKWSLSIYTKENTQSITEENLGKQNSLISNYPNPFNSSTIINFNINENTNNNSLMIYNLKGEIVKKLYSGFLNKGSHNFKWNGTNNFNTEVSAGLYLVKLIAGNQSFTGKLIYAK